VKLTTIVHRDGLPMSIRTHATNHHEVTLFQPSFDLCMIEASPESPIGCKVSDGGELDPSLKKQGVRMIATSLESQGQVPRRATTTSP